MNTFPTTLKINTIKKEFIKPRLLASYDGGYEQTRPKYTRKFYKFTIGFSALTNEEAGLLEEFFDNNQGKAFIFVNQVTGISHIVRFNTDSLSFNQETSLRQSVEFEIKEV